MLSLFIRQVPQIFVRKKLVDWWTFKRYKEDNAIENESQKKKHKPATCCVAIVGLGGVGKSLAHLLKMYPDCLTELRLCNRSDPEGMVEELSHIPTRIKIRGFKGEGKLGEGLRNANVVVICAGAPRRQNTTRDQLFAENAVIVADIVNVCADHCPEALISVITNPVDSLVPIAAEALKKKGVYDPGRLFGICTLDQIRAQRYYAEAIGAAPSRTYVPVVGGHSEITTVPLFSKARPKVQLCDDMMQELVKSVRVAGRRVVQAKKGSGGSTYSMASATMYFVHKLCRAIHHEPHLIISAYVESGMPNCPYFSNELLLGPCGVDRNLGYGEVETAFEKQLMEDAIGNLNKHITLGLDFAAKNLS